MTPCTTLTEWLNSVSQAHRKFPHEQSFPTRAVLQHFRSQNRDVILFRGATAPVDVTAEATGVVLAVRWMFTLFV